MVLHVEPHQSCCNTHHGTLWIHKLTKPMLEESLLAHGSTRSTISHVFKRAEFTELNTKGERHMNCRQIASWSHYHIWALLYGGRRKWALQGSAAVWEIKNRTSQAARSSIHNNVTAALLKSWMPIPTLTGLTQCYIFEASLIRRNVTQRLTYPKLCNL